MPKNSSSLTPMDEPAFLRLLVEHAAVGMIATDADYRIVAWNAAATELLGRPAAGMVGRSLVGAIGPERAERLEDLLARTVRGRVTTHMDIRAAGGDGQVRELTMVLSPIPASNGAARGVSAWIVNPNLGGPVRGQDGPAHTIAALGALAGGVAHHFNNILGGVATFVDHALASGDPAAMKRALRMTAEATGRVVKITQSLQSFATCSAQEGDLADLTEVVLTFANLVERPLAEQGIRLDLDLHPVPVMAIEATRMHQVLGNLLTNAEEAMPQGGRVCIRLEQDGRTVQLRFSDTGCGIPPEQLGRVFEPFFTTKGLLAGGDKVNPGLGLSVAGGIVAQMGGRVHVASEAGKGTTFTLSFPVLPA